MANITLSVEDQVLTSVRRYAMEHDSSVNALVREFLTNLSTQEDQAGRARARLRQMSEQSEGRLGRKALSRDDLHDR